MTTASEDGRGIPSVLFICVVLIPGIRRRVLLKLQKFRWTNAFTIKMFIFANFIQNVDFERSVLDGRRSTPRILFLCVIFIACIRTMLI